MFTRDSKILSHRLTTPLTAVANAVGDVFKPITLNTIIKSLFANNEQGFFYDPNDLTTMYQDAAGTIPVTGTGQAVGLMLDKSKGLVLGGERWNPALTTTSGQSSKLGDNKYRVYSPDGAASQVSCGTGTTGKWYEITLTIESIVSGAVTTDFSNSPSWNSTGVKKFKGFLLSPAITFKRSGTTDAVISNISIKELKGNHAYQTTSAARPILRKNAVTGANYLEFDGSDDFLQTNNIDFTATDKVSLFAGVRKLSDASQGVLCELSSAWGSNSGSFIVLAPAYSGGAAYSIGARLSKLDTANHQSIIAGYSAPITNILSVLASTDTKIKVDGILKATNTADKGTGSYGNYPLYIGRRGGTTLPFNGHIYSLIGIGRLATDAETTALEKLIAKNTGVTLSV